MFNPWAVLVRARSGQGVTGHPVAGLGAAAAGLGAAPHGLVVAHPLAVLGAAVAHLGAGAAGEVVELRAADHEVGAGLADLRAVEHQPDVGRLGVPAPPGQAVGQGRAQADLVALLAVVDTLL